MTGRVNNVNLKIFVTYARNFAEDRDALFALQIVAVHHAVSHVLVFAERARLLKNGVNQGGLSVVNVRDDSDVTNACGHTRLYPFELPIIHKINRKVQVKRLDKLDCFLQIILALPAHPNLITLNLRLYFQTFIFDLLD